MPASRLLLLSLPLALLLAPPSEAQQLAPVVSRRDCLPTPRREISAVGTILGGIGGGVVGTFAGFAIGAASAHGCRGEECQLSGALLGGVIGESLGLAVGSHLGSRSSQHEHIVVTALTSTVIFVGGTMLGIGLGKFNNGMGAVIVPLTPALQLAAALAIESR
jgi:hypothetical protein